MIRLQCDCGRKINAPDQFLGKRVKCPQCGKPVTVRAHEPPAASESIAPAASPVFAPTTPDQESAPAIGGDSPVQHAVASEHTHDDAEAATSASIGENQGAVEPETPAAEVPSFAPPEPSPPELPADSVRPVASRPVAPAPTANAVSEEEPEGSSPQRLPSLIGGLALLVGIASIVVYWVPAARVWTVPGGILAVLIAILGLIISFRRDRFGLGLPALALFVGCVGGSLPWTIPMLNGKSPPALGGSSRTSSEEEHQEAAIEAKRRGVLAVDSLKLVSPAQGMTCDIEYKVTNVSGKPIKTVIGSVQIYDPGHRALGGIQMNLAGPIAPKGSISGQDTWTLSDDARTALDQKKFTAEYRAEEVLFEDGSQTSFSK